MRKAGLTVSGLLGVLAAVACFGVSALALSKAQSGVATLFSLAALLNLLVGLRTLRSSKRIA